MMLLMGLMTTLACYSQESYQSDLDQARCDTYERCDVLGVLGYDSVDSCVDSYGAEELDDCTDFDPKAAKECVEGWELLECGDMATALPQACLDVCAGETTDTAE